MHSVVVLFALLALSSDSVFAAPKRLQGRGISGIISGELTFYGSTPGDPAPDDVHGTGACGRKPDGQFTDLFAALNGNQFNPFTPGGNPNRNSLCHSCLRISCDDSRCNQGASVVVQLVDSCQPCSFGDVDVSLTAMSRIAKGGKDGAINAGRFRIKWEQVDCNSGGSTGGNGGNNGGNTGGNNNNGGGNNNGGNNNGGNGKNLQDWEKCTKASECQSACCSNVFSNGVFKCTPKGSTNKCSGSSVSTSSVEGPLSGGSSSSSNVAGSNLGEWVRCSKSSQCANKCCSKEFSTSDGQLKCTPNGKKCI